MLTVKTNTEDLRKLLFNNTPVISVSIFFGENDQVVIKIKEGKVLYTASDRVYWKLPHRKNRSLILKTFGQLLPGLNFEKVTFYGLFLKEDDQKELTEKILKSAKLLRTEIFRVGMFLNNAIDKLENLGEEKIEEKE